MSDKKIRTVGSFLVFGNMRVPLDYVMAYGINTKENRLYLRMHREFFGEEDVAHYQHPRIEFDDIEMANGWMDLLDDIMEKAHESRQRRRLLHD